MRTFVRFTLIPAMILTGASIARAQVWVGIAIGIPPPRAVYVQPAPPGQDFVWVEGYCIPWKALSAVQTAGTRVTVNG
jgi:hypothetical protein